MRLHLTKASVAALVFCSLATGVSADTLRLALAGEHQSVDPHFSRTSPNQNTAAHIFDTLVTIDEAMQRQPSLAVSWKALDDLTWEIKLREGVKFHDGSDFDSADVISSVERVPNVANSPAPFTSSVSMIDTIEAVDALTLRVTTKGPTPGLMQGLGGVYILPSELGNDVASAEFDNGNAAIGTGPYKFVSWTPNESLVLDANETYWAGAPAYDDVVIRYIPNAASRVATLLAGDVDAIDKVPPADTDTIEKRDDLKVVDSVSGRVIYLHMDSDREVTPFITEKDGSEIKNPLRDARVRKALSLMLDRGRIVQSILSGKGTPTGQMVPEGFMGFNPAIDVPQADIDEAKRLLAEAGYPDGFKITIHGPNDRYVNDAKVLQAVSQLFARAGLTSEVQAMPKNVYFKSASKREFSVFLVGFGTTSGDSLRGLRQVMATYDKENGVGTFNRGRFSNEAFDELVAEASATFDEGEKAELLEQAAQIGFDQEQGILPLYFEQLIWGMDDDITLSTRPIERTLAQNFAPKE
ncbi:oligopeptide-binding protein AppA (plasmid) [Maritalea myrionectae]|uniref:Oligopeptide-binding protein AppA n=1 Tax=Maritalea myrionectae TaxID=454601 RepID=A0A2R4MJC5_9HYPH|nr:ABC transporter substrate-binding protein [Maritalea myrionectae]AVX06065.1 oligopeptide-binding protein AppA [Maritalea myrionectae]